jgi:hypothetical protein
MSRIEFRVRSRGPVKAAPAVAEVGPGGIRADSIRVLNRANVLVLVRSREHGGQSTCSSHLRAAQTFVCDPSGRRLAEQLHQLVDRLRWMRDRRPRKFNGSLRATRRPQGCLFWERGNSLNGSARTRREETSCSPGRRAGRLVTRCWQSKLPPSHQPGLSVRWVESARIFVTVAFASQAFEKHSVMFETARQRTCPTIESRLAALDQGRELSRLVLETCR